MNSPDPALLRTAQLELVAGSVELANAELERREDFATQLGCSVPSSWPPGEYDHGAITFLRDRMQSDGAANVGWFTWYGIRRDAEGAREELVGAAGYFGPPTEGVVEIGYSVVPEARRRGIASEMAKALVQRAFGFPEVKAVIAHTFDSNPASIRVLERNGFRRTGPGTEAGTVRYRIDRTA